MLKAILDNLPPRVRAYVVGALILVSLASASYAVATFAADRRVGPLEDALGDHMHADAQEFAEHVRKQTQREEYDRLLQEAIWTDLRALCRRTGADCDGPPIPRP